MCPPHQPTLQSAGQVPRDGLGDPPRDPAKCSNRRGKGEPSKLEGSLAQRQERGRRQGNYCPEETPGEEARGPEGGSLARE